MIALGCIALIVGGVIVIGQNLFLENPPIPMFQGVVYGSLGLIIGGILALMLAYQKTIDQMNEIIKANEKKKANDTNLPIGSTMMFMGGLPTDMTPEQISEYRKTVMKKYMGVKEDFKEKIFSMSDEELQQELKIQEDKEDFEKAALVRDEINRRKSKEN
jgi:gas vesicle protein